MATPLVNGNAYTWSQIELRIFNTPIYGITKITYSDDEVIEDNFGQGNRPVSRGRGQIKASASITLEMAEVEALQDASPTGSLNAIPEFDIVVSYLPESGIVKTHTLKNCRFKGNKRDVKSGDTTIEVDLELAISHIIWK